MTVPRSVTLRPKYTSPVTVKWSSSMILGIFLKRFWNCWICKVRRKALATKTVADRLTVLSHLLEVVTELNDR